MMNYTFTMHGDPSQKLERIKTLAAQKGVTFNGNLKSGTFYGGIRIFGINKRISGSYTISGNRITVSVTEKPDSYTWDKIESELRGFIEG